MNGTEMLRGWGLFFVMLAVSCCGISRAAAPLAAELPGPPDLPGMTRVNDTVAQFDQVRALLTRALMRAQDVKLAYLYGRGWGLEMPEGAAEDLLIDGLWLFERIDGMDLSAKALISYGIAGAHPNLDAEVKLFQAFLPQAARDTIAYHDRTTRMLQDALAKVNAAAQAKTAFTIDALPVQPWSAQPAQQLIGDGFNLGFYAPVLDTPGHYRNFLQRHNYPVERLFAMMAEAGIDFFQPTDVNVFDWADVCARKGEYDWSAADRILALHKKYNLPFYLSLDAPYMMPPDWLIAELGSRALLSDAAGKTITSKMPARNYLMGIVDRRADLQYPNLFDDAVASAYGEYLQALLVHVKAQGVRLHIVNLPQTLPAYAGSEADRRLHDWLAAQQIDPQARWGLNMPAVQVSLTPDWLTQAETALTPGSPAAKRLRIDLMRFREDEHFRWIKQQVDIIRAVEPQVPISTSIVGPFEFNESMNGRNDGRLARELGLIPYEGSNRNSLDDARRGLSPVHASSVYCSTGCGLAYTQYQGSAFAHDAASIITGPYPIIRAFYHGEVLIYPDMRWEWSALYSWRRFHERAQGMGPEKANTRVAPQVAMLSSDSSNKFQSFIEDYLVWTYGPRKDKANYHVIESIGWGHLLDCLQMPHDVLTEEQVLAGALNNYKMLVAPACQALPANVSAALRAFVEAGGTLIATSAPGLYDERMERQGNGQLAEVFGADFTDFRGHSTVAESPMTTPVCDSGLYNVNPWQPNAAKAAIGSDSLRTLFCSFTPREGATVLEKFTDGQPAVVMNKFGAGQAVVIGYPMGRESFLSDTYHMHYGNNWPDNPDSSRFTQGLVRWIDRLLGTLQFTRQLKVLEEYAPRSSSMDVSWPSGFMPRAMQEYRDFTWQQTGGSSVELMLRTREGNPSSYLELYNRESTYGQQPGIVQVEASSKQLKLEVRDPQAKLVYDLSLGCPVPATFEAGKRVVFSTLIEPAMSRMFVISPDDTIRRYQGNRTQGGASDADLRLAVARVAGNSDAPLINIINANDIRAFLAERGGKGMVISCEQPEYLPAAQKLAAAIQAATRIEARITRNAPRIKANSPFFGLGGAGQNHELLEEPDILLGNRAGSHHIARYAVSMTYNTTMRLPFMPTRHFPGPGKNIVMLTRPYQRIWGPGRPEVNEKDLFKEQPAPSTLVIGASDAAGLATGVDAVIKLLRK